jgi:rhamnosyl/mannosyltransferase
VSHHETLNVCHLGKYYPPAPGGIETHVQTLARAQAKLGANVRVVCINHQSQTNGAARPWTSRSANETVEEFDGPVKVTRVGRTACVARLDIIPGLPAILDDLQQSKIDVLHLHTPNPTMLITVASLRLSAPLVIMHHSDIVKQRLLKYMMSPFERLAYARATAIIASSDAYADGSTILQNHADKVESLPMGLDLEPLLNPSERAREHAAWLKQEHGPILWLAVGRFVYYKGLHTAIAALKDVPGKLLIVGTGPLENDLRRQANSLGVADRVVWCGRADSNELVGAYHAANAFWFPSTHKSEAFGLVQVEAMACGCPVINTDIPGSGVSWVSLHEQSGLTVKVNDAAGFAAAARRLLDEPGLRERLSAGAVERAKAEFDHLQMAQRSLDLYRRVMHRGAKVVAGSEPAEPDLADWVRQMSSRPE